MKIIRIVGVLLAVGVVAFAPRQAWTKDLRIAVVNMQRAVGETEEGKNAEAELQRMKEKLENELNRQIKELYQEEEKLRKAWSILKDDEKRKRAEDSRKKFEALRERYVQAERELMKRKTDVMLSLTEKLSQIIEQLARRDKYDYIFANAAVLWAPRHVDVTNEVIRMYNDSSGSRTKGKGRRKGK